MEEGMRGDLGSSYFCAMRYGFSDLLQIMARLRGPEGCPWDREQTHTSLLPYLFEEATEFAEAVHEGSSSKMCEELGDVLLQVVFHAQVAAESGKFAAEDVIHGIAEKLVRRHPHVFADAVAETPGAVSAQWEEIKQREKGEKSRQSAMDPVKKSLPALTRARELQRRAAQVGFDWPDARGVLNKIREEIDELARELTGDGAEFCEAKRARAEEELGDVFFALVNLARHTGLDSEQALIRANAKFERRFRAVEEKVRERGGNWEKMTIQQMDVLWNAVKAEEKREKNRFS